MRFIHQIVRFFPQLGRHGTVISAAFSQSKQKRIQEIVKNHLWRSFSEAVSQSNFLDIRENPTHKHPHDIKRRESSNNMYNIILKCILGDLHKETADEYNP